VTMRGILRWIGKALPPLMPLPSTRTGVGGWYPIVREPYTGAWQKNDPLTVDSAVMNPTVFACVTRIASDVSKIPFGLVVQGPSGTWTETSNPAFSPVLRRPNRYQVPTFFFQQWMLSKLLHGNTYVLKERDQRGVVVALYVLDPTRVTPLVAPDGSVFYQLARDVLGQVTEGAVVPASEIVHDLMYPMFHPLCGVTPILACGAAALQGLTMQQNQAKFFANGSQPGGVILVPSAITQDQADKLRDQFQTRYGGDNRGRVAVLTNNMKYEPAAMTAVDSELIKQLQWTDEQIPRAYGISPFMVGVGPMPPYGNVEQYITQYFCQTLQVHMVAVEQLMDDALGLVQPINGTQYGTQFDYDDLIWLDMEARGKAATQAAGTLSPNEARARYYGAAPVAGGDSPMVQQQYFSLEALAKRDAADPFSKPTPAPIVNARPN
jgi:HK97 family phage portal protein